MSGNSDKIKSAYKDSKDIYDDMLTQNKLWSKLYIRLFWNLDFLNVTKNVLDNLPENFSGKLLDVPCGTINLTSKYYEEIDQAEIEAIDYTEEMVEIAHNRADKLGLNNLNILQGDVGALPYEDSYFDAVISMNGFHAFPDKKRAYTEIARVLKDGGMFCGCHYIHGEYKISDFIVKHALARKGWFTPPFQTKDETLKILKSYYSHVEIFNDNAIVWFKCVK